MKNISHAQLGIFKAVVEQGSLGKAAKKLSMAPPSLSKSLKLLEKHIGIELFDRTNKQLVLTDAGHHLYRTTGSLISQLDYAINEVRDLGETPSGSLRITMSRLTFEIYFKHLYADFCKRYPSILLELSFSDEIIDIVDQGFDFGIRFGDKVDETMISRPVTQPFQEAIFATPDYLQKHGNPSSLEALADHRVIQYRFVGSGKFAPFFVNDNGERRLIEMKPAMIVNDTAAVIDAARAHLGIGRMLYPLVAPYLDRGDVVPLFTQHWFTYPALHIYYSRYNRNLKRYRVFLDYLFSVAPPAGMPGHIKNLPPR